MHQVTAGLSLRYIKEEWRINIDDPNPPEEEAEGSKPGSLLTAMQNSTPNAAKKEEKGEKKEETKEENVAADAELKTNSEAVAQQPEPEATVGDTGRTESLARQDALALCHAAVRNDPVELSYAGEFRRDPEFCTEAVRMNGLVLQYVDAKLKDEALVQATPVPYFQLPILPFDCVLRSRWNKMVSRCNLPQGISARTMSWPSWPAAKTQMRCGSSARCAFPEPMHDSHPTTFWKELHDDAEFMLQFAHHTTAMQYLSSR